MATSSDKIPWCKSSVASVLQLVKQNRFLWDQGDPLYHKVTLRQEAFKAIAEKLKLEFPKLSKVDGASVRLKFKSIRSYFLRTYKKVKHLHSFSSWPLYSYASFMLDTAQDQTPALPNTGTQLPSFVHPTPPSSDVDVVTGITYEENPLGGIESNTEVQLSYSEDDSHLSQYDNQLSPSATSNSPQSLTSIFTISGLAPQQETDSSLEHSSSLKERKRNSKRKTSNNDSIDPLMDPDSCVPQNPESVDLGQTVEVVCNGEAPTSQRDSVSTPEQNPNHRQRKRNKKTKAYENGRIDPIREPDTYLTGESKTTSFSAGMGQIVEAAANRLPYHKQVELLGKICQVIKEVSDPPA